MDCAVQKVMITESGFHPGRGGSSHTGLQGLRGRGEKEGQEKKPEHCRRGGSDQDRAAREEMLNPRVGKLQLASCGHLVL